MGRGWSTVADSSLTRTAQRTSTAAGSGCELDAERQSDSGEVLSGVAARAQQAEVEKQEGEAKLTARRDMTFLAAGLSIALYALAVNALDYGLLEHVGADGIQPDVDRLTTVFAAAGGTKALHELIGRKRRRSPLRREEVRRLPALRADRRGERHVGTRSLRRTLPGSAALDGQPARTRSGSPPASCEDAIGGRVLPAAHSCCLSRPNGAPRALENVGGCRRLCQVLLSQFHQYRISQPVLQ
jgi:hypothetical protein